MTLDKKDLEEKEVPTLTKTQKEKREKMVQQMQNKLLEEVSRKMQLNETVKNWEHSQKGVFAWIQVLKRVDEYKLWKLCGTDIALYLLWLRQSGKLFWYLSLLNLFNVALYLSGSPSEDEEVTNATTSVMRVITVINVSGSDFKVLLVFLNCMVTVTAMFLKF